MTKKMLYFYVSEDEGRELMSVLDMTTETLWKLSQNKADPNHVEANKRLQLQLSILTRLQKAKSK